jgi:nicotinamidase/pyrazinamidase
MIDTRDVGFDERSALLVIDVQNDFADPRGGLYVNGGQDIIPTVNRLVAAARDAGALAVYTQDWHPGATPHFQPSGGTWPVHCVAGTWGAELHPGLEVDGPVVRKGTGADDGYSGFTARDVTTGQDKATELRAVLEQADIRRVVVVGLAQDVCVQATALDARRLGYHTTVLLDATRPVNLTPGDDQRSVEAMLAAGVSVR